MNYREPPFWYQVLNVLWNPRESWHIKHIGEVVRRADMQAEWARVRFKSQKPR